MNIGQWIRRDTGRAKWHLVESIVADDAITRCGRRMEARTRSVPPLGLEISDVMPLTRMPNQPQLCKSGCS
jgi:hypothetical protein